MIGPYCDGFRDAIKARIPAAARLWLPLVRAWTVDERYAEVLDEVIYAWSDGEQDELPGLTAEQLQRCVVEAGMGPLADADITEALNLAVNDTEVLACVSLGCGDGLVLARFRL